MVFEHRVHRFTQLSRCRVACRRWQCLHRFEQALQLGQQGHFILLGTNIGGGNAHVLYGDPTFKRSRIGSIEWYFVAPAYVVEYTKILVFCNAHYIVHSNYVRTPLYSCGEKIIGHVDAKDRMRAGILFLATKPVATYVEGAL